MKKYRTYLVIGLLILLIGASFGTQADIKHKNISNQTVDIKPVTASSIDTGMIGYWSHDENSGSITHDDSGHGCDGTIGGTHYWIAGINKNGLEFDGYGTNVDLDSHVSDLAFNSNDDYSVSLWVSLQSAKYCILYHLSDPTGFEPSFTISMTSSGNVWADLYNGEADFISAQSEDTIPADESWHHIVVVVEGGATTSIQIFIDRAQDGFDEDSMYGFHVGDFTNMALGKNCLNDYDYFDGIMDEVRVYNRALSYDEIEFLYEKPSGLKYTLLWGKFDNLNMNAGNFVSFECVNVWTRTFSPFTKAYYQSGETIRVDPVYQAYININLKIGIGLFLSNVN